jgi:peptidoglycan/xylan/chitin deacetylase (PgdA/CDA1 family)
MVTNGHALHRITHGLLLASGLLVAVVSGQTPQRGGLVLQFDDGWTSWRTVVAPELARVGARATAFVNNQNIHSGRISFDDLRALQDEFGWEIGTHTYNHHNAVRHVQQHGLDLWMRTQLQPSLTELREAGLTVQNLVFPFNAYTPDISRAVLAAGVGSFRRADALALAVGRRDDGSLPGTSIDLTRYVPVAVLKQWVDMAHARGQLLLLYGHRVLPDESFVTGRVAEVSANELVSDVPVVLPQGEDVVLVPDLARRSPTGSIGGLEVEGRRIRLPAGSPELARLTTPGATYLVGPAYGTRLSDLRELLDYAAGRLAFYTVADIVDGKHGAGVTAPVDAPTKGGSHETPSL